MRVGVREEFPKNLEVTFVYNHGRAREGSYERSSRTSKLTFTEGGDPTLEEVM